MSDTYDESEYVSPETGEIETNSDPDADRKRVIIPVGDARSPEKKQVGPLKKEAVKKQVHKIPEGRKPSPRLRRATHATSRASHNGKAPTHKQSIKKFTILIPDELLRKFRIQALTEGMTYSALGVEAIQSLLKAREGTMKSNG